MVEHADAFCRDLKSAVRSLGRAKGLTVAVILTLALGIGANAAMFSLVRLTSETVMVPSPLVSP